MKPNVKLNTRKRELRLTGFTDEWTIPVQFMLDMAAKGIVARHRIECERRGKWTLVITLGSRWPVSNMMKRLAEEVSKATRRPDVHDIWHRGGQPVDLDQALPMLEIELREIGKRASKRPVPLCS